MSMTKEEAACSIYGLEVTTENAKQCLECLESAGLVPVKLVNGDPSVAFAIGVKKLRSEPWRFKEFTSSLKRKEIEEKESESSFEVSVLQSKRAVLDLVKLIMPSQPITGCL